MGISSKTITKLVADLRQFISDAGQGSGVMYEHYRELPEDLEPRKQIKKLRIAIYAGAESEVVKVGAEKPSDSRPQFGIDISIVRGYRGDDGIHSELVALDYKDLVVDWIKQLDAFTVTEGGIHSFGLNDITDFTRRKRFATLTLNCSGLRDMCSPQHDHELPNVFDETFDETFA